MPHIDSAANVSASFTKQMLVAETPHREQPPNWDALHRAITHADFAALKEELKQVNHLSPEHANALLIYAYQRAVGGENRGVEAALRKLIFFKSIKDNKPTLPRDWLDQSVVISAQDKRDEFILRFIGKPSPIESLPSDLLPNIVQHLDPASAVNMLLAVPCPAVTKDALIRETLNTLLADAIIGCDRDQITALGTLLDRLSNPAEKDALILKALNSLVGGKTLLAHAVRLNVHLNDSAMITAIVTLLDRLPDSVEKDTLIREVLETPLANEETPLADAILSGDADAVSGLGELLDRLSNPAEKDALILKALNSLVEGGKTLLAHAVRLNDSAMITAIVTLLDCLSNPAEKDALIKQALRMPLKEGDGVGMTLLAYAISIGDSELITALGTLLDRLSKPAERNALIQKALTEKNQYKNTPLANLFIGRHSARVRTLGTLLDRLPSSRQRDALITAMLTTPMAQQQTMPRILAILTAPIALKMTSLTFASLRGDCALITSVGTLLDRLSSPAKKHALIKQELMSQNGHGEPLLSEALFEKLNDLIPVIGTLLDCLPASPKRDALITAMLTAKDRKGRTPFVAAILNEDQNSSQILTDICALADRVSDADKKDALIKTMLTAQAWNERKAPFAHARRMNKEFSITNLMNLMSSDEKKDALMREMEDRPTPGFVSKFGTRIGRSRVTAITQDV